MLTSGFGDRSGDDAEVKGTVVLDGDHLLLDLEGNRYPVVWPRGHVGSPTTSSGVAQLGRFWWVPPFLAEVATTRPVNCRRCPTT